jgi:NAD(P)-dependent dehydrogenase (short-subunit alcohol dehydrogenase family)
MSTSAKSSSNGNGRVAIVTGGTANLGKLFAESLAGDGVNLVVHYNSPHRAQEAADVLNELEGLGVEAIAHQGDLTDTGQITQLVDATIDRFGKWDILVNTAGLIIRKPLVETSEKDFDDSFAINAKIPYFFMREAYDKMADNGRIINMVTTQVAVTAATYSAYAGSKAPVSISPRRSPRRSGRAG